MAPDHSAQEHRGKLSTMTTNIGRWTLVSADRLSKQSVATIIAARTMAILVSSIPDLLAGCRKRHLSVALLQHWRLTSFYTTLCAKRIPTPS
jgi:hypothetical protein